MEYMCSKSCGVGRMRKEWLFTAPVYEGAEGGRKDVAILMSNSKQKQKGMFSEPAPAGVSCAWML